MRILGGVRGDTADGYFRITAPFSVLRYSTPHSFEVRAPALGDAYEFDVLWLQRHCEAMAEIIVREFKDQGKPVIYDTDDWLFGMPPSWSCYPNYYRRGAGEPTAYLAFHERMMRLADAVTCPTEYLAQKLRHLLAQPPSQSTAVGVGNDWVPPVYVLPNCILQADWDTIQPLEADLKGPLVGWFGLDYHWDDLKLIAPALDEALEELDGHLAILGFPEVVQCFSDRLAARTRVQSAVSWPNFGTMRQMIAALDVGIAWLDDTEFNRCKSPLKAFQYGAAGVPVVVSKTVYGELPGWWPSINPGGIDMAIHDCGVTVKGFFALRNAIAMAATQREQSLKHANAWQQKVWREHSYEQQAYRWLEVIEHVYEEKRD